MFVTLQIMENSVAARDGRLKVGQRILEVCSVTVMQGTSSRKFGVKCLFVVMHFVLTSKNTKRTHETYICNSLSVKTACVN